MSTPETSNSKKLIYTPGGIRKSLLTPCRRVGLSRIRKTTPNGIPFKSPIETNEVVLVKSCLSNTENNVDVMEESVTSVTRNKPKGSVEQKSVTPVTHNKPRESAEQESVTPVTHNKLRGSVEQESLDRTAASNSVTLKNNGIRRNVKARKNILLEKNTSDEQKDSLSVKTGVMEIKSSLENSSDSDSVIVSRRHFSKTKRKRCVIDSDDDDNKFFGFTTNGTPTKLDQLEMRKKRNIIASQSSTSGNECEYIAENEVNISSEAEKKHEEAEIPDSVSNSTLSNKETTNTLDQIKREHDYTGNETHEDLNLEKTLSTQNSNGTETDYKSRRIRRKLSLKKDISTDSFETDEPLCSSQIETKRQCGLEDENKEEIIDEIIKLEKTVQHKETELHRLQQAKIYRNVHKVEDLKRETEIWKVGCQNALRDLLQKLNKHTKIDMNTLFNNLKVPPHVFKYDNEKDCFI